MTLKRMVLEIGMGTDIRGADYTKAAVRALRDALWHNSLSVADALGRDVDAMVVDVTIGVPRPDRVDKEAVARGAAARHGNGERRRRRAGNSERRGHRFDGDGPCRRGRAARYRLRVCERMPTGRQNRPKTRAFSTGVLSQVRFLHTL